MVFWKVNLKQRERLLYTLMFNNFLNSFKIKFLTYHRKCTQAVRN